MTDTTSATATRKNSSLQAALDHAKGSTLSVAASECPTCDRTGLSILVVLYGVIPTQNYGASLRESTDYLNGQLTLRFDHDKYLAARPLNAAQAGGGLECSQYTLRRLRKGYLHVYYPDDGNWERYDIQGDGRLLRMQLDATKPMGIGNAACKRFVNSESSLLLKIDPAKHPNFWIGFSDVAWTSKVRDLVKSPENLQRYMTQVNAASPGAIGSPMQAIGDAEIINDIVAGFQSRPQTDTLPREAYPRHKSTTSAQAVFNSMASANKLCSGGKISGLLLPLPDTVGIATQLSFARNLAYLDIMGEGDGYSDLDRQKMNTAALLDNIKESSKDAWSRIEDNLKIDEFKDYREKFFRCWDSQRNFQTYSADYTMWMEHLHSLQIHQLFDSEQSLQCTSLSRITADLYEGCGMTEKEFDDVLLPQLQADANDPEQLFWRGAAANEPSLLEQLRNPSLDKTLLEGVKKAGEVQEQWGMLGKVGAAKAQAAQMNRESWARLSRVLASRARRLHDKDAKTFRRTMRRIQAVTLQTEGLGIIEHSPKSDASGYITQLRNAVGAKDPATSKIKFTPRNNGQIVSLSQLLVTTWKAGQPMPKGLETAVTRLNLAPNELPASTVIDVGSGSSPPTAKSLHGALRMNAGLAALQAFGLASNLKALSIDLAEAQAKGPNWERLSKDLGEVSAAVLGLASGAIEAVAIANQLAADGTKTARFWQLSKAAGFVGMIGSVIEGGIQIKDGYSLWKDGDKAAGAAKGLSGLSTGASGVTAYAATRILAREALKRAGAGAVGELAAAAAAGSIITRGGAAVTVEAPPVALWLGIASATLWAASIGLDFLSKRFTTVPLEKWADRSYLGNHTNKWGPAFTSGMDELHSLLRQLYAIKVEQPSNLDLRLKCEVQVPVWGTASRIDLTVRQGNQILHSYVYENASATTEARWELQLRNENPDELFNGYGEAVGEGAKFIIEIGDQSVSGAIGKAITNGITPIMVGRMLSGAPTMEVKYWPNLAAYPGFMIDGRSAEEVEKAKNEKAGATGK